ncbi:unnamed protein product [Mycena citricolor]|uniref:Tetraspanin Tsp2 n=1 Tax=Mycena citricolor TaxID=2018698 RepID=A0AAD2H5G6_9AGAR|nr:unnamed protein product [Mycena citricolor]
MDHTAPSRGLRRRSGGSTAYHQVRDQDDGQEDFNLAAEEDPNASDAWKATIVLVRRQTASPILPVLPRVGLGSGLSSPPRRCISPLASSSSQSKSFMSTDDLPTPGYPRDGAALVTAFSDGRQCLPIAVRGDRPYGSPPQYRDTSASSTLGDSCSDAGATDSGRGSGASPRGPMSVVSRGLGVFSRSSSRAAEGFISIPVTCESDWCGRTSPGGSDSGGYDSDCAGDPRMQTQVMDKFTHKWPGQRLGTSGSSKSTGADTSSALLETGHGPSASAVERHWTSFKRCLVVSVVSVFVYGSAALVCALMTWFRTWDSAAVMYVADNDVLILITLAGSILVFTALVGLAGVLLNSRPILAMYAVLLWPAFMSLVSIGYVAYKRATFSLDRKLDMSWSQYYTPLGRLLIQDALHCCGFYSPLHDATPSKRCFARTSLPGCKGKLFRFERENLATVWAVVFSLVPLHLLNIFIALLCANHVTERFGTGMMPVKYRLSGADVQAEIERLRIKYKLVERSI